MPMIKLPLTVEFGLLGFVRRQPLHGYEIVQRLRATAALGLTWGWQQSQIYADLARLEQEGYLTSTLEAQGARPPRKIFQLTEAGAAAIADWIVTPVAHGRDFELEFPVKLYFAQQDSRATARMLVARQHEVCQGWLADLRAGDQAGAAESTYGALVLQFRSSQIETIRAWLETCAAQLGEAG